MTPDKNIIAFYFHREENFIKIEPEWDKDIAAINICSI
jgi:hypothetical protein